MKTTLLTGVLIFSLVLNVAVGLTLLWHIWWQPGRAFFQPVRGPAMADPELAAVRRMWVTNWRSTMMKHVPKIAEKNMEVLELIAKNPGNPRAADKAIEELVALRAEAERNAIAAVSKVLAELPEEKRDTFLAFMRDRACMGKGLGPGPGKGFYRMRRDWCPRWMRPE